MSTRSTGRCGSRSPRSTSRWATSTGTRPRSATTSARRPRPARRSSIFPELAINGYPPEDLLLKTHFLEAGRRALDRVARDVQGMVALVGFAEHAEDVYNSLAVLADGRGAGGLPQDVPAELRGVRRAALLPGRRCPGGDPRRRNDHRPHGLRGHLGTGPAGERRGAGRRGGDREHLRLARITAERAPSASGCWCSGPGTASPTWCSATWSGGQDELVFDGYSLVVDQDGELVARGAQFRGGADRVRHRPLHGRRRPPA